MNYQTKTPGAVAGFEGDNFKNRQPNFNSERQVLPAYGRQFAENLLLGKRPKSVSIFIGFDLAAIVKTPYEVGSLVVALDSKVSRLNLGICAQFLVLIRVLGQDTLIDRKFGFLIAPATLNLTRALIVRLSEIATRGVALVTHGADGKVIDFRPMSGALREVMR